MRDGALMDASDARDAAKDAHAGTLDEVFSTRRPRDLAAGLSSGLRSVTKGVALGAAALVAAPVGGAMEGGFAGFARGLGVGVASAVALPVVGVSVGAAQIGRGLVATPQAVAASARGERWDGKTRTWIVDDLETEGASLGETTDEAIFDRARARAKNRGSKPGIEGFFEDAVSGGGSGEAVRSTEYYDVLGVAPDASAGEIRRQYYVLARKLHPDKNLGDPEAKERFQKIGEAYQVLSDDNLRAKYDARGKDGLGDLPILNPAAFFAVLFGSEFMEGFVGRLQLASLAVAGTDLTEEEQDLLQNRRESRLAIKLAAMLDVYVDSKDGKTSDTERAENFVTALTPLADKLASASFGTVMLAKIGWCYSMEAEKYLTDPLAGAGTWLDLGFRTNAVKLQQKGSSFKNRFSAFKAGVSALQTIHSTEKSVENATSEEEKAEIRMKQQLEVLPHIVEALWSTTSLDIERTLRHVGRKVLHDASASKVRRSERAVALAHLGKMFQSVARETAKKAPKNKTDQTEDVMRQIEEALRAAFDPN